ncbi:MAG: delta-60 repeat domain-containing protein, partial [Dokdonella sp.]
MPNLDLATNGFVETIVRQPDGAIIIGGYFASIDGVPRSNIARILPNGALDPTWNPSADNSVSTVAVDTNGDVYIGGSFEHVGGQTRSGIAKVAGNGAGLVDPAWNPSPDQSVHALAVDGAGSVYAGGAFSQIGGATRSKIAKLSTNGAGLADPDWNPSASASVYALTLDGTALYAGGYFSSIGGQTRGGIAKLATAGTGIADPTWHPFDATSGNVQALSLDHNGSIYAGGSFNCSAGNSYNNLVKMATAGAGSIDAAWHPSPNASVAGLLADGAGHVYVGGSFISIGGAVNRNY